MFLDDWKRIFRGLGRSIRDRKIGEGDTGARLGWLLIVGTIPAGLLGLAFEHPLRTLFASAQTAAAFLILNGILLLVFERFRRRPPRPGDYRGDSDSRIAKLTWREAFGIGTAQAAALIPGISRSGITMGGGLLFGLSNEDAARYAFLLATPIIGAAGVLKLPELLGEAGDGVRGAGPGRGDRRGAHHLPRGQVPAALLRDQPADPVRDLLHPRRHRLLADHRPLRPAPEMQTARGRRAACDERGVSWTRSWPAPVGFG